MTKSSQDINGIIISIIYLTEIPLFEVTSESKKPRQITVVIHTAICLGFFDSDVSKWK